MKFKRGNLQNQERVKYAAATGKGPSPALFRRRNGSWPHTIGTVGHVVFLRAHALLLRQPVIAELDFSLSLLSPAPHCAGPGPPQDSPNCLFEAPPNQYGPADWLIMPARKRFGSQIHARGGRR